MTQPALSYHYACFEDGTTFVYEIFRIIGYCVRGNNQIFTRNKNRNLKNNVRHLFKFVTIN